MTDAEAIAELTSAGTPLEAYFLFGERGRQLVACWHPCNGVMALLIHNGGVSRAYKRVLRKHRAREFQSAGQAYAVARQERWPGWEKFQEVAEQVSTGAPSRNVGLVRGVVG